MFRFCETEESSAKKNKIKNKMFDTKIDSINTKLLYVITELKYTRRIKGVKLFKKTET